MSTVRIIYVECIVAKRQRHLTGQIKVCNFFPPSGWLSEIACSMLLHHSKYWNVFFSESNNSRLKSLNLKISVGSAYEMKLPGMCIVGIQWLNLVLPIGVFCLCVSQLSSRVLQVACYVRARQLECFGADDALRNIIYMEIWLHCMLMFCVNSLIY